MVKCVPVLTSSGLQTDHRGKNKDSQYYLQMYTVFTQCSDCRVEPQMRGQTPFLPLSVNANHLPRLRGLTRLLFSSKFVWLDPACGVWHRFLCVCKQKARSAPAMYGTFPCVARGIISYLSSFDLPRLRGLLLEWDHCVNAGQWNPARTDLTHLPGFDPGIGALCKRGIDDCSCT